MILCIKINSIFKVIPRYDKFMEFWKYKFEIVWNEECPEGVHQNIQGSGSKKEENSIDDYNPLKTEEQEEWVSQVNF